MTLRDWLVRERRPDRSGINARQTLQRLGARNTTAARAIFGLAVESRAPDIKRALFKSARTIKESMR